MEPTLTPPRSWPRRATSSTGIRGLATIERQKKQASKTRHWPDCGVNAWAKAGIQLICGDRYEQDDEIPTVIEPAW